MRPSLVTLSCCSLMACLIGHSSAGTLSPSLSRLPATSASASVPASAASAAVALPSDAPSAQVPASELAPASSSERTADARPGDGQASRAWLAMQASGAQASRTRPTLSGPVLQQVHERYLKSFSHPIPDQFPAITH